MDESSSDDAGAGRPLALRRWPDNSPAAVADRRRALERFRERLAALDEAGLSGEDALNHELLTDRVGTALAQELPGLPEFRRDAYERFDLRRFHDLLLGAGPMPLTSLERRVATWIAAGG